jgi:hypothetical protein
MQLASFLVVATLLAAPVLAGAAERKPLAQVDLTALTGETQLQLGGDGQFGLAWWIPAEFWEAAAARQPGLAGKDAPIARALAPYLVLGIIQADVSDLGGFSFFDRSRVQQGLRVTYAVPGGAARPLRPVEPDDPDVGIALGTIRPILANALGNAGQNMHFFTLVDAARADAPPVSPLAAGELRIEVGGFQGDRSGSGRIETPLNALFVPRLCPGGRPADIRWKVCPWDGTPLPP